MTTASGFADGVQPQASANAKEASIASRLREARGKNARSWRVVPSHESAQSEKLVARELARAGASLLCLQEVDRSQFRWLHALLQSPHLSRNGQPLPRGAAQVKLRRPVRLHCLNRLWLYRSVLLKLWHNTAPLQLRKLRLSHVQRQTIVLQYLRHVMYSSTDRVSKTHLD